MKIFYATGPGNIIRTYRFWKDKKNDPNEVAMTYSGHFFDTCKNLNATARVITQFPQKGEVDDGSIRIENLATPWMKAPGVKYYLGQLCLSMQLLWRIGKFRPDFAVITEANLWFLFAPLKLLGIKVIPSLHCVLWPKFERQPIKKHHRLIRALNGWYFRHCVSGVMCVSDEIAGQVLSQLGTKKVPILVFSPIYSPDTFGDISSTDLVPDRSHHNILFVGRIEANKGVFDLVEVAKRLRSKGNTDVTFDICGNGSALESLKQVVSENLLNETFRFHGTLGQRDIVRFYKSCFAVIVPTKTSFIEGFNKVVAEGILSGKPVITSPVCPAVESFRDALVVVPPEDIEGYHNAVLQLIDDPKFYSKIVKAGDAYRLQLFDHSRSWGATLKRLIFQLMPTEFQSDNQGSTGTVNHVSGSPASEQPGQPDNSYLHTQ